MLYNGTEEAPEREDMKLSDAFEVPSEGYEWTAHLININDVGVKRSPTDLLK